MSGATISRHSFVSCQPARWQDAFFSHEAADQGDVFAMAETDDAPQRNATDQFATPVQQERRAQAHTRLLTWYARNGRKTLPWRHTRDPYAILVSEVMLQQTQVERVLPKYQAFLARFPTLAELAVAPTSEVIKEWAGLGYNLRAVRLQQIAQAAMSQHEGTLPATLAGLLSLKGIGRYTAGAIACFAFGQPIATVDTNIRRVLWRVFMGIESGEWQKGTSGTRDILALAEWALPGPSLPADETLSVSANEKKTDASYDWQQALMDLGATVCQSRRPLCERCPLTAICAAYAEVATQTLFPSGEALARLRDERIALREVRQQAPHTRQVAESRASYDANDANDTSIPADASSNPTDARRPKVSKAKQATQQSFTSTTRYFRGRIVDALRALPMGASLALSELGPRVKPDYTPADLPWLRGLIAGLARDGLARWVSGEKENDMSDARVSLP